MPLTQRLMALAETLQFGWFVGHVTLLLSALSYGLTYVTFKTASGWARFNYRTAFVAAAATYGIVVYKAQRARARQGKGSQGGIAVLAADENVQYLGEQNSFFHTYFCRMHKLTGTIRHGIALAILISSATSHSALRSLLRLPRRNIHKV